MVQYPVVPEQQYMATTAFYSSFERVLNHMMNEHNVQSLCVVQSFQARIQMSDITMSCGKCSLGCGWKVNPGVRNNWGN
jgi:predicted small metal-binding protein